MYLVDCSDISGHFFVTAEKAYKVWPEQFIKYFESKIRTVMDENDQDCVSNIPVEAKNPTGHPVRVICE